eukprot:TRINITY_DN6118_c0_g1_i1.p1 TRINITY_DN6118_c0_g1~~TRINITY_DN6118_c0_g1_i1.p1  ORF type:complete len:724 (+),score=106.77 TRINITY_DN6118_c0_g1_i1:36-2174(+)
MSKNSDSQARPLLISPRAHVAILRGHTHSRPTTRSQNSTCPPIPAHPPAPARPLSPPTSPPMSPLTSPRMKDPPHHHNGRPVPTKSWSTGQVLVGNIDQSRSRGFTPAATSSGTSPRPPAIPTLRPVHRNGTNGEKEEDVDKDDPAYHYMAIAGDPRYVRLLHKWAPRLLTQQTLKNMVDPSNIPIFGFAVKAYRANRTAKKNALLRGVHRQGSSAELERSMDNMVLASKVDLTVKRVGVGVSGLFLFVPVDLLVPGVGTGAGVVADKMVASGAEIGVKKGISEGAKVGARAGVNAMASSVAQGLQNDMHGSAGRTKALLHYLGLPANRDDALYTPWEDSRLFMKRLYGAADEDDLWAMKPDREMRRKIRRCQVTSEETVDISELGVSLLWILFNSFECWDEKYFDKLERSKQNLFGGAESARENERYKDYLTLQQTVHADHKEVMKLTRSYLEPLVKMVCSVVMKDAAKTRTERETQGEETFATPLLSSMPFAHDKEKVELVARNVLTQYFSEGEVWGYVVPRRVQPLMACALWVPLKKRTNISTSSAVLSLSAVRKLGISATSQVRDYLDEIDTFRADARRGRPSHGQLHLVIAQHQLLSRPGEVERSLVDAITNQPHPVLVTLVLHQREGKAPDAAGPHTGASLVLDAYRSLDFQEIDGVSGRRLKTSPDFVAYCLWRDTPSWFDGYEAKFMSKEAFKETMKEPLDLNN